MSYISSIVSMKWFKSSWIPLSLLACVKFSVYKQRPNTQLNCPLHFKFFLYQVMHQNSPKLCCEELDNLDLIIPQKRRFGQRVENLETIMSVTELLWNISTTLSDEQALFHGIIGIFTFSSDKLSTNSSNIHSPDFDSAMVQVQVEYQIVLSRDERISIYVSLVTLIEAKRPKSEWGHSFAQQTFI